MSISAPSVRSPTGSANPQITVDGMVSLINNLQSADSEQFPASSFERLRRSRQRSAAVLLTTMFNAMGSDDEDGGGDRPNATVYADIAPCLDDVFVEYGPCPDPGTLTLVIFGLLDGEGTNRFVLTQVSPGKWEYDGLIYLPPAITDATVILNSEILGDVGYVSLSRDELSTRSMSESEGEESQIVKPFLEEEPAPGSGSNPTLTFSVTSVMTERTRYMPAPTVQASRTTKEQLFDEPLSLASRGRGLKSKFDATDERSYLDEAAEHFSQALALVPATQTGTQNKETHARQHVRVYILLGLGDVLTERFARFGQIADIAQAIGNYEEALTILHATDPSTNPLLPNGFPATSSLFWQAHQGLGIASVRRYDSFGDIEDLERAVAAEREGSNDENQEKRLHALGRLGTYLMRRFGRFNSLADLDEAVDCQRQALEGLSPDDGVKTAPILHSQRQSDLGSVLLQRFKAKGNLGDVHEAIALFREAASSIDKPISGKLGIRVLEVFNGLAMALMRRFERLGDLNDINDAISAEQRALRDLPLDFPDRHTVLNNLALCFQRHYQHTQDADSLHETVQALRQAIDATPRGHPMLMLTLNNYATALSDLYLDTGHVAHIEQAVAAQLQAIDRTPAGHPSLSSFHDNLGHFYRILFGATSDPHLIQLTIMAHRKALELASPTHPEYPLILSNLGASLVAQHTTTYDPSNLREAIEVLERSLSLTPAGHSHAIDRQRPLAGAYYRLYLVDNDDANIDKAFSLYSLAASLVSAPSRTRISVAEEWVRRAQEVKSEVQTFKAMEAWMKLVAFVAGMEQSLERRYKNLSTLSKLVLESAAFAAIELHQPGKALEWLEQGRGLVWRQLSSLRTPLDDLEDANPAVARQLKNLNTQLEQSSTVASRRVSPRMGLNGSDLQTKMTLHNQAAQQTRIFTEREEVLRTIRTTIPGFENFLQAPSADEILQHLPEEGPVVILGAHSHSCYALALIAGVDEPLYIPLALTWAGAQELSLLLETNLARHGVRERGDSANLGQVFEASVAVDSGSECGSARGIRKYVHNRSANRHGIGFVLRELWLGVAKPIVESLALPRANLDRVPSRIWWCPTGPLTSLPLHAAGVYNGSDPICVADYAVSSYTPTITVLVERVKANRIRSIQGADLHPSGLLILSQPDTPGCTPIPGTAVEAAQINQQLALFNIPSQWLDGEKATISAGLKGMGEFNCIHLACHATQRQDQPLQSGFYLHDGRVELSTIMKSNLKNADLAFLSACQTSAGSSVVSEEAVHLAAGMLSAGYRGVVATMWSIQDEHAPQLAADFYQYLLVNAQEAAQAQTGVCMSGAMASYALHHAARKLRERLGDSETSFLTWVPYVHFGL